MPTMESESSIVSRAEELKSSANEAFKGTFYLCIWIAFSYKTLYDVVMTSSRGFWRIDFLDVEVNFFFLNILFNRAKFPVILQLPPFEYVNLYINQLPFYFFGYPPNFCVICCLVLMLFRLCYIIISSYSSFTWLDFAFQHTNIPKQLICILKQSSWTTRMLYIGLIGHLLTPNWKSMVVLSMMQQRLLRLIPSIPRFWCFTTLNITLVITVIIFSYYPCHYWIRIWMLTLIFVIQGKFIVLLLSLSELVPGGASRAIIGEEQHILPWENLKRHWRIFSRYFY